MDRSSDNILTIDALKTGFRSGRASRVLLNDFSTSVAQCQLIAVIGKNGSGKSTLLRTITGLQEALSGRIILDGSDTVSYSKMELAKKVSYISTEPVRVANMNVYELVSLGRFPYTDWTGRIDQANHQAILSAIEKTGMKELISVPVGELSDGERQRAMIARVMAQETRLMIMDEPTAFLDIGSKFEITQLLHDLARYGNRTIIFSTHDLHLAMNHADKIWLLKNSGLVEGAPEDLMLQGEFDHIFDSSSVKYDAEQGTFTFSDKSGGSIYIEGEGVMRGWTEKALIRAGYTISYDRTEEFIIVPSAKNTQWKLISGTRTDEFNSIYELLRFLKTTA